MTAGPAEWTKNENGGACYTKESVYKSYDELPLFLNADTVAKTLGISISSCYELIHEKDFPSLTIGNRIVIPKENFILWVRRRMGGAVEKDNT